MSPDIRRRDQITCWHLLAFVFFLPFDRIYTEIILISLLAHVLFHLDRSAVRRGWKLHDLAPAIIFLVGLVALSWSTDRSQGLKDLQRQLGLLLLPVLINLSGLNIRAYRQKILSSLAIGVAAAIAYLYLDAIRVIVYTNLSFKTLLSASFINHNFSAPIEMHATYLSMLAALAFAFLLEKLVVAHQVKHRLFYSCWLLLVGAGLFQLASRAVWIAVGIYLFLFIAFFIQQRKQQRLLAITAGLAAILLIMGVSRIDSFRNRYVEGLRDDLAQANIQTGIPEPRYARWSAALEKSLHAPVIGYGYGSEKRVLENVYFERRLYQSYLLQLNTHNEYLSIFLKMGIVGLLVYLWLLAWGWREAWSRKDAVFSCFMILVMVVSFSENILDVNKGIFFFGFFFSFFLAGGKPLVAPQRLEREHR